MDDSDSDDEEDASKIEESPRNDSTSKTSSITCYLISVDDEIYGRCAPEGL